MRTNGQMFKSETIKRQINFLIFILSPFLTIITYPVDLKSFRPQFHGPNRDNISTKKGLLKKWSKNGHFLLWTAGELGHGYSSVSIANGVIYTTGSVALLNM